MESQRYICNLCKNSYNIKKSFQQHVRKYKCCSVCNVMFCTLTNLRKHELGHRRENVTASYASNAHGGGLQGVVQSEVRYQPYYIKQQPQQYPENYIQQHYTPAQDQSGRRYGNEHQGITHQQNIQLQAQIQEYNQHQQYLQLNGLNYMQQPSNNVQDASPSDVPPVTSRENSPASVLEHVTNGISPVEEDIDTLQSIFSGRVATYVCGNKVGSLLPENFFSERKLVILKLLKSNLVKHTVIKFNMELYAEYVKPTGEPIASTSTNVDKEKVMNKVNTFIHATKMILITLSDDVDDILNNQIDIIKNKMSEFQERDSGWALQKIVKLHININRANLTRGSQFMETPRTLEAKKACINIENTSDNYCFKWCMVAALSSTPVNPTRTNSYNVNIENDIIHLENGIILNFKNIEFPLSLQEVKVFERKNDISVNVFGYDNDEVIGPYHLTKAEKNIHVNLMLLHNNGRYHYILIKNMSR